MGKKFPIQYRILLLCLMVSILTGSPSEGLAKADKPTGEKAVANVQTSFFIFNLAAEGTYDITKNGGSLTSAGASFYGAVTFDDVAAAGDSYVLIPTGVSPTRPTQPTGLTASGESDGCVTLDWNNNPEPNIVSYTVYWARQSVSQGQLPAYTDSAAGITESDHIQCSFSDGTYYFAVRARNSFSLMSPLSSEQPATVNVVAQPPSAPEDVAVAETSPGCATVTWTAGSEPDLAGYYVYYGTASYTDSVDAGNDTELEICQFSQGGTFHFAVKAYNSSDQFSAFSSDVPLVVDITPPTFANLYPADGATGVMINTNIAIEINDPERGVDNSTVEVRVSGATVADLNFGGPATSRQVSCVLTDNLPPQTLINVTVIASDQATFANTDSISWSFTTGDAAAMDTVPPVISEISPADGSTNVPSTANVSFRLTDAGAGVDFANVILALNGETVELGITGNNSDATFTYENNSGFTAGEIVDVMIIACDRSSPPNCTILENYSFQVASALQATGVQGEIIPDGFWNNSPDRPLEIRNLPLNWTVRIFNTAGTQVRSFTNRSEDGYNWIWSDFANDSGTQVARALYLIRITDAGGSVMRSGRFLVQRDP